MASIQQKGDAWYCQFFYLDRRHTYTIGKVTPSEAAGWKSRTETLLMRLRQNLLTVPPGVAITDFILNDGKPPVDAAIIAANQTTLHQLRQAYLATVGNGVIEANTLYTITIQLNHIEATYGKHFVLSGLTLAKLQEHINRRAAKVQPVTIKKEIDSFRAMWNWGGRMKLVSGTFPSSGLSYPKSESKLPYMLMNEIERRINAGGDADSLWECLYLDIKQIAALLTYAKARKGPSWVYPALIAACHTGARKSEIIRARVEDVDLMNRVLTVREKKRARGVRTSRRVPISKLLASVLTPLVKERQGKPYLFDTGDKPLTVQAVHKALWRLLKASKWSHVTWHTCRHSFVSNLASAGTDARLIDEFVGHTTPEQRRRYTHLLPDVTQKALHAVFG